MEDNFKFMTFSFFETSSLTAIKDAVRDIFNKDIQEGRAQFISRSFSISEFVNPPMDGVHDDIFCVWKVKQYPCKVFFISNSSDGRQTLCNVLHLKLSCSYYQFAISSNAESPFFLFHYSPKHGIDRDVLNYKENKWVFYEKGPENKIEEKEFYKRRVRKERLNKEILIRYLKKTGVILENIDKNIINYFIFKRIVKTLTFSKTKQ